MAPAGKVAAGRDEHAAAATRSTTQEVRDTIGSPSARARNDRRRAAGRFNNSKAAKALGITRHQLYIRMRRHGLESDGPAASILTAN
jgi:transcriptional regulator of acetoin/glycerol metabolism